MDVRSSLDHRCPSCSQKRTLLLGEYLSEKGWYGRNENGATAESDAGEELTVTAKARRKAWARLLAKVYEIDALKCPKCGGRMSVVAVIRDPDEIRKIIMCLETKGRGPP